MKSMTSVEMKSILGGMDIPEVSEAIAEKADINKSKGPA